MSWKESFKKYAKKQSPNEACGLLAIIKGKETFWPCKNLAEGKHEFFMLDPDDWADCEDTGEVMGVIHSHPKGSATPSETDKAMSASLEKFCCVNPPANCSINCKLVLVFVPHVPAFSPVA